MRSLEADKVRRLARGWAKYAKGEKAKLRQVQLALPPSLLLDLKRAFTPAGLQFFLYYLDVRKIDVGLLNPNEADLDLIKEFRRVTTRLMSIKSPYDGRGLSPAAKNYITDALPDLRKLLGYVQKGDATAIHWRQLYEVLGPLYTEVAKDKGVYLAERTYGAQKWVNFKPMSAKQEKLERLKDLEPETYSLLQRRNETLAEIDAGIEQAILEQGLEYAPTRWGSMPVHRGIDPVTGEAWFFNREGEAFLADEYQEYLKKQKDAQNESARVQRHTDLDINDLRRLAPTMSDRLDKLPGKVEYASITDDGAKQGQNTRIFPVKDYGVFEQDPETGDLIKRSYKIVVGGRYKGIYLDDLVSSQGRLIEGVSFNVKSNGAVNTAPVRMDPTQREPYVTVGEMKTRVGNKTVTQKKLYIRVAGDQAHSEIRNALKALAINAGGAKGSMPSVVWASSENLQNKLEQLLPLVEAGGDLKEIRIVTKAIKELDAGLIQDKGRWAEKKKGLEVDLKPLLKKHAKSIKGSLDVSFYFDPKDFSLVRDKINGMTLSKGAKDLLQDYFKDLTLADEATADENLKYYDAKEIGGFITGSRNKFTGEWQPFELSAFQKKSLAWLDANDNKGVCGLDTGLGKTAVCIASIRKQIKDGVADVGTSYKNDDGEMVTTNGRFLFVCPPALKGNLKKDMSKLLTEAEIAPTKNLVDVVSYKEFTSGVNSKRIPANLKKYSPWKEMGSAYWPMEEYVAVYFDEAHEMSDPTNSASRAAQRFRHPKKILLTASPLEKSPMESYVLGAIANNVPMSYRKADHRKKSVAEQQRLKDEVRKNQGEMKRFKERYCEVLGGRIMGLKEDPEDPNLQQDLRTWVKRNIFFADKRDETDPRKKLKELRQSTHAAVMDEDTEKVYRKATSAFSKIMKGLVTKFRDKGILADGKVDTVLASRVEEVFKSKFVPILEILNGLSNYPSDAFVEIARMMEEGTTRTGLAIDGRTAFGTVIAELKAEYTPDQIRDLATKVGNPKMESVVHIVTDKAIASDSTSRTLLFSDDEKMCRISGMKLSEETPGKHLVALSKTMHIFQNGKELTEYRIPLEQAMIDSIVSAPKERETYARKAKGVTIHSLPFRPRNYKRHQVLPAKQGVNTGYKKTDWQTFVFQEIVGNDATIKTATLHGKTYETGQNLQMFDQVIHLDRDTWNSESMKQRTARAWRQGQTNPVDEITVDATFATTSDEDKSMDEIRGYFQEVEGALFDSIIKKSQSTVLGVEWDDMEHKSASYYRLDTEIADLMTSPYLDKSKVTDTSRRPR